MQKFTIKLMPTWPWPRIVAHRGGGTLAPENTLAAFEVGYQAGYRMAEYDVKLSADDVPILLHDDTVDRTSNGHGAASALDLSQLQQLDFGRWHGPQWAGKTLPTLQQVAAFCLAHGMHSNIEIKPSTGLEAHTGRLVARQAASLWASAPGSVLLSSFSETALAAARDAAPHLPRALLIENQLPSDWQARAHALGCLGINLDNALATEHIVKTILEHGYTVVIWTVNDLARAQELLRWGCHAIVTDTLKPFA